MNFLKKTLSTVFISMIVSTPPEKHCRDVSEMGDPEKVKKLK